MDEDILLMSEDIFVDFICRKKLIFSVERRKNLLLIHKPFQNVFVNAEYRT